MRAVGIKAFGNIDVLESLTIAEPQPGPGQARVKVAFAGVNRVDVHVRRGNYLGSDAKQPTWPLLLGYEGAGEVAAVGPSVDDIKPGDRVAWCGSPGALCEQAIVPAWRLVPVPEKMPLDVACALQIDGMLAHALSVSVFPIKAGDVILINGGAEPACQLLAQVAKVQGAKVIATVARETDVGAPKAAGADHVIVLANGDGAARIAEITGGQGCSAVFDFVGRDTLAMSLASCWRRGVMVLQGATGVGVDHVNPDDLAAAGSIFLVRPHLADFMQDATEVRWRMDGLFDAWLSGRLKLGIGRVLPLDAAREAHMALESGTETGKILIKM